MNELNIINNQDDYKMSDDLVRQINKIVDLVLDTESISQPCEISLVLINNDQIRELNSQYRQKDSATDVLSFPQYASLKELKSIDHPIILGDIIISLERAISQAKEYGHSVEREICYLVTHSMFHLLGYDHLNQVEKEQMRSKEKHILKQLKIFK